MLSSTFDIFSKVILEKNYSYSIPQDKELILYDFYMLVHLNALKKEGKFQPGDKKDHFGQVSQTTTHSMGLDHSTEFSFEEIKKQLIGYLQPELLEASLFSISCELRHVFDNNSPLNITATLGPQIAEFYTNLKYNYEKLKKVSQIKRDGDSTIKDLINKRRRKFNKKYNIKMKEGGASRNTDYRISYKALKQTIAKLNISEVEVAEIGRKSFLSLQWGASYGGKPWASICDAYIKLYYAKREVDQIIYIDNMYHQQHNTDTVFNKLQSYYKSNAGYRWVLNALNFKADVKDNWDRIKKIKEVATIKIKDASGNVTKEVPALRSIDRMYIEMLKASGDRTWEQYYKVEKAPPKEEVKPKKEPKEIFHDLGKSFQFPQHMMPGKVQYQDTSSNIEMNRPHWNKMAKEGFKKFGKIYNSSGNELIAVGPGVNTPPHLMHLLDIDSFDLFMRLDSGSWSGGNEGSSPSHDYAIPKDIWIKKFGKLPKEFDSSDKTKYTPNSTYVSKFIAAAKQTDSDIYKKGFIFIGNGVSGEGLVKEIGVSSINNCSGYLDDELSMVEKTGCPNLYGNAPSNKYYLKKSHWEDIFGPFEEITGYKEKANKFEAVKKYFIKVAKEFKDESSFEEATAGSPDFWVSLGNSIPKHLADPEDIQNGATITLSNIIGGDDLSLIKKISKNIGRIEHSNSGYCISDWGGDGILGAKEGYQYVMKKTLWESLFGKFKPSEDIEDDKLPKNDKITPEIIKKYRDNDNVGYTVATHKFAIPSLLNAHHLGFGQNVAEDIHAGVFPKSLFDKEAFGKIYNSGSWETLNNEDDVSFAYRVWMKDKYWQELFGDKKKTRESKTKSKEFTEKEISDFHALLEYGESHYGGVGTNWPYVGTIRDVKQLYESGKFKKDIFVKPALVSSPMMYTMKKGGDLWIKLRSFDNVTDLDQPVIMWIDIWKKYFGEHKPVVAEKKNVITPEVIKKYQNLAKSGHKQLASIPNVKEYIVLYVGTAVDVLGAIKDGIFTQELVEDYMFGTWMTGDNWSGVSSMKKLEVDLSPGTTIWMKDYAWTELFGPIKNLIDSTTSDISPGIKRKFKKLAKIENALPYLKDSKTKDGEQLIYIGKGSLRDSGFPMKSVKPKDIYGGSSGASEFSNNMLGTSTSYHYFITAKKWKEIFDEEPPTTTKEDDSKSNIKVSGEVLLQFSNLAREGYKKGHYKNQQGDNLIYIGKGPIGEKGLPNTNIYYNIYAIASDTKTVEGYYILSGHWSGDNRKKDYFITATDWTALFGIIPPNNLNI